MLPDSPNLSTERKRGEIEEGREGKRERETRGGKREGEREREREREREPDVKFCVVSCV